MAIPDYQSIMLPLLKFAGDKKEHSIRESIDHISKIFKLNEDEKRKLLSSGQQPIIDNRVGWARTYLKKAKLLESTKRSYLRITDRGLEVLKKNPAEINVKYLEQFSEFIEFKTLKKDRTELPEQENEKSPKFFEKLVIDLLLKMGYGDYRPDAGEVTGKSGDEGIDGIIKEDKLGLDIIYIQAKKGVFITTTDFSEGAKDYAERTAGAKIRLIDGDELSELMINYDIGVSKIKTFEIKKVDSDYFIEE